MHHVVHSSTQRKTTLQCTCGNFSFNSCFTPNYSVAQFVEHKTKDLRGLLAWVQIQGFYKNVLIFTK